MLDLSLILCMMSKYSSGAALAELIKSFLSPSLLISALCTVPWLSLIAVANCSFSLCSKFLMFWSTVCFSVSNCSLRPSTASLSLALAELGVKFASKTFSFAPLTLCFAGSLGPTAPPSCRLFVHELRELAHLLTGNALLGLDSDTCSIMSSLSSVILELKGLPKEYLEVLEILKRSSGESSVWSQVTRPSGSHLGQVLQFFF